MRIVAIEDGSWASKSEDIWSRVVTPRRTRPTNWINFQGLDWMKCLINLFSQYGQILHNLLLIPRREWYLPPFCCLTILIRISHL